MKLVWEQSKPYSSGVDRGVLYLPGGAVAWNGLVSVTETLKDSTNTDLYFDGIRYDITTSQEDLDLAVLAFTYPPEFAPYDGRTYIEALQQRLTFGFCYRVMTDKGYDLHIVYNAVAGAAPKSWKSLGSVVDLSPLAWNFGSVPAVIAGAAPGAHLIVTSDTSATVLTQLENILYGTASVAPRQPTIAEVIGIFTANPQLFITDNGDGTWTATGPDNVVYMTGPETFEINWPLVVFTSSDTYNVRTS